MPNPSPEPFDAAIILAFPEGTDEAQREAVKGDVFRIIGEFMDQVDWHWDEAPTILCSSEDTTIFGLLLELTHQHPTVSFSGGVVCEVDFDFTAVGGEVRYKRSVH